MKRITLFVFASAFLFLRVKAQNSSPYWSLAGNSNSTSSSKLGNTTKTALNLITNNTTRLYISPSAGYVAVGTTSPSSQFQVNAPSGVSPMRFLIGGSTRLLASSNGGLTVGNGTAPPAQGLYVSGSVGIGTATPAYKLHVEGGSNTAIYGNSSSGYGVYGYSGYLGVYGSGTTYGVYGSGNNYGVYGYGANYGVYGYAYTFNKSAVHGEGTSAFGVSGNSTNNYGGYFTSTTFHGLIARTSSTDPNVYAAIFQGSTYCYGTYTTSDERVKKNIADVKSGMDLINQLKPKSYEFTNDGKLANLNLPKGAHFGFLAQDVEKLLPGLVRAAPLEVQEPKKVVAQTAGSNTPESAAQNMEPVKIETMPVKAINYTELIPVMVKGMQELDAENKSLHDEVDELKQELADLKATVLHTSDVLTYNSAYLEQNTPNPVNEATTIRYHLPTSATSAVLNITNAKGQLVKTMRLNKGADQTNLNTTLLASGTYNYTLIIDGKQVDTKRLVVAR